jgi:tRNA-Thr(GGU) m(6)t(6)A37 methyltransferase TsaA
MRELLTIAHIETDFPTKFGVPRQSGLVSGLKGRIVFEPEYRNPEALRGLDGFSHIWLLWDFSEARRDGEKWQPTVRPPRLGGNRRMGVFATRSPFRPNNIGLSSVRILSIDLHTPDGPVIEVEGADLMDGTPIFDIKPYLPFTDSHPDAVGGFADAFVDYGLQVNFPAELLALVPEEKRESLLGVLAQDPRPAYQEDPARVYGFGFAGFEIKFTVAEDTLTVQEILSKQPEETV